jgi:hypothetical protein
VVEDFARITRASQAPFRGVFVLAGPTSKACPTTSSAWASSLQTDEPLPTWTRQVLEPAAILGLGGSRSWDYELWVRPLPPSGPLGLLCQWPAKGIPETRVDLDGAAILQAASRAVGRPTFISQVP